MRHRLADHLLTLTAATSLMLAVGVCVLWVRGHWRHDRISRDGGKTIHTITSLNGRLAYTMRSGFERGPAQWELRSTPYFLYSPMSPPTTRLGRLGFAYSNVVWSAGPGWPIRDVYASIPHWLAALGLAVLPAWRTLLWQTRCRHNAAHGFEVGQPRQHPAKPTPTLQNDQ